MKRKLIVLLILAFTLIVSAIGLVACGEQSETAEDYKTADIYAVYKLYAASEEGKGNIPLSYEQWLLMIKGEKGEKGEQGERGADGTNGKDGENGTNGKSAYEIWLDNGHMGTESDFLEWIKGEKGEQGERGADGTNGTNGKSAYEIWLDNGHTGTESDFLEWLKTYEENPQGLDFYPLPDGTYGVGAGKALYLETVVIPTTYKNKSVTKIVDWAFAVDERTANKSLTSITIPDSVTSIGDYAFHYCSSLTSVTIPDSVTSIGEWAFHYCSSLTSITIGESVTGIGLAAFFGCSSLTSITIPDSVTSIGSNAFNDCSCLASITIPDSVTSIGEYAFSNCSCLTSVTIGNSVTSIGQYTFSGCGCLIEVINKSQLNIVKGSDDNGGVARYAITVHNGESKIANKNGYTFINDNGTNYLCNYNGNETELVLPSDYNGEPYEIYNSAFSGCSSLTSITIPDSVTSIGDYAFSGCSSLTSITIGESVTSIGDYAFSGCSSLTSITIGESVTGIGLAAFFGCSSLTSITIPDSVTSIGSYAFFDCSSLTTVNYNGTAEDWAKIEIGRGNNALLGATINYLKVGLNAWSAPTFQSVQVGGTVVVAPIQVTDTAGNSYMAMPTVYDATGATAAGFNATTYIFTPTAAGTYSVLYTVSFNGKNYSQPTTIVVTDSQGGGGTALTGLSVSAGSEEFFTVSGSNVTIKQAVNANDWKTVEYEIPSNWTEANGSKVNITVTNNGNSIVDVKYKVVFADGEDYGYPDLAIAGGATEVYSGKTCYNTTGKTPVRIELAIGSSANGSITVTGELKGEGSTAGVLGEMVAWGMETNVIVEGNTVTIVRSLAENDYNGVAFTDINGWPVGSGLRISVTNNTSSAVTLNYKVTTNGTANHWGIVGEGFGPEKMNVGAGASKTQDYETLTLDQDDYTSVSRIEIFIIAPSTGTLIIDVSVL